MSIMLDQDILNPEGEVMNSQRDCCLQTEDGSLTTDRNGDYVIISVATPKDSLTLKRVCIRRLVIDSSDTPLNSDQKYEKYKLFDKVHKAGDSVQFTSDEFVLLKQFISDQWGSYIMVHAVDMLETKE